MGASAPFKVFMLSLYKPATKENHKYETEGVFYFYETCDESELDKYLADGWVTTFSELKGLENGLQGKDEEVRQEAGEEVKRRGRPKAK